MSHIRCEISRRLREDDRFSGGCRTCWPVLLKMFEFIAGRMQEMTDTVRKGPLAQQNLIDFIDSVDEHMDEVENFRTGY